MLELAQQEPDTEKQNTYLLKAQKAGHQLLLLVDELLDISRIEAKVLTFEKVDFELIKVLDTVIAPITASAEKKGLTFSYDASSSLPKFVNGDPMRLAQSLRNIVNNAIKFTDNGGVSVNVKLSIVDKQYLLDILINDSGIGIAPADHERVFNKFVQVSKGANGSINGTGLGLTIAKEFAQGMGGSLTLNSAEGKGSTFKLSIPLGASQRNSATSKNNETSFFCKICRD
ncbi:ATP-binding protein [Paraglaciecola sp. Hal342]